MKILHVIASMNPELGGVSQAVRSMIAGLNNGDVVNEVVSLDIPGAAFINNDPFTTYALGPAKTAWQYSKALQPWLMSNACRFNVVILHGLWLYQGYAIYKALKTRKHRHDATMPKLYVMPHGMLDPYFQKAANRKLKALRNVAFWKFFEQHVVNTANAMLFTCEEELQLARVPFKPYKPKKEHVIGLGVETPPAYTQAMKNAFLSKCPGVSNKNYFLFLSRIHEKKGVDLLIKAYGKLYFKLIAEKSQTPAEIDLPYLVIAGPDPGSPYGKEMQELAFADERLRDRIFFPGMLSGDSKWGAFYNCEAFVLPSHQENFGIAIVEAMACAKPVLISNKVNIWREISAAQAGVVKEDTQLGTEEMLNEWQALTPAQKSNLGVNAINGYLQYFSVKAATSQTIAALST